MKTVFRISSLLLLLLFAVLLTGTAAFADDSSDLPFMVGDQEVNTTTESLNLAYATPEEISRVIAALPSLPNLHSLILGFAAAEEPLVSWDQIRMIQEARPDLDIDYSFSINAQMRALLPSKSHPVCRIFASSTWTAVEYQMKPWPGSETVFLM